VEKAWVKSLSSFDNISLENLNNILIKGTIEENTYNYEESGETTFIYKMNSTDEEYGVIVSSNSKARIISCEEVLGIIRSEENKLIVIEDVENAWVKSLSSFDNISLENLNNILIKGTIEKDTYNYKESGETTFIYKMNSTNEEYGVAVSSNSEARIISCEEVLENILTYPQIATVNEKLYYFENEESAGEEITKDNVGKYLGMKVAPTSYSTSLEIDDETVDVTYRLFYIDFDGEYGDKIKNTIYLKSDCEEIIQALELETYDASNVQKFNLGYKAANTTEERNTGVSWLLNSSNWERYCDKTKGATAAYGAPSLEMWVRSYNQFLNYNKSINNVLYNANSKEAKTLAYNFNSSGYYVGEKEGVSSTRKSYKYK
jgi:hypothetical protein